MDKKEIIGYAGLAVVIAGVATVAITGTADSTTVGEIVGYVFALIGAIVAKKN